MKNIARAPARARTSSTAGRSVRVGTVVEGQHDPVGLGQRARQLERVRGGRVDWCQRVTDHNPG